MSSRQVQHKSGSLTGRVVGAVLCCLALASGCRTTTGLTGGVVDTSGAAAEGPIATTQVVARGKPLGVSVTANGLRSAVLTWSAPAERVYRYRIERAATPEGPYVWLADVDPNRQTFSDGLTPDTRLRDSTAYYYRLSSIFDKFGLASEPTQPVKTVTAPPPAPPDGVKALASGSRAATVSWQPAASEGVVAYRIERAEAARPAAFEKVGEVTESPFVDGGTPASTLKDSTAYLYRVVSVNRVTAESAPSATAAVTTLPPPAAPLKPAAASELVRCVTLTWQPSPEQDVVRYDIYQGRAESGPFQKIASVQGRTTTEFTDGGGNPGNLEDEGTYYYRVRAVNAVTSESADSQTARAVTRAVPPEVQRVAAVSARPREVPLSWAASPDTAVVGYEVWRAAAGQEDWEQIVRLSRREAAAYVDRGGEKDGTRLGRLADGTEYEYKVIAFNTGGVRSSASGSIKAKTKVIPVPPAGVSATTNLAAAVRLTWQKNPEPDVSGYLVEVSRKSADGFRKLAVVHAAAGGPFTAEEAELDPDIDRFYRVKALDREGLESEWSAVAHGRSKPLPGAPAGLQATAEAGAFRLTWQPPPQEDVTHYKVWSKRLLGWDLVGTATAPEYRLERGELAKAVTLAVSAVDKDKQEGERSEPVKVDPLAR